MSQAGPHAAVPFTTAPTTPEYTLDNPHFRILLQRRLRLPLDPAPARCSCGGALDPHGDHRAACPTSGHLRVRAAPMERALARVFREAGAWVSVNVPLSHMNRPLPSRTDAKLKYWRRGSPYGTVPSWPLTLP